MFLFFIKENWFLLLFLMVSVFAVKILPMSGNHRHNGVFHTRLSIQLHFIRKKMSMEEFEFISISSLVKVVFRVIKRKENVLLRQR